jgi:hypothetical protein
MDGNVIAAYGVYVAVALCLTTWLARTLFRNSQVFLDDVFEHRPELAASVNHLLVIGFFMLNIGWAFLVLRSGRGLDAFGSVQFLINRLAVLLVSLGLIHFVNVFVFWRIRARTAQRTMPPPVTPQVVVKHAHTPARPDAVGG